MRHTTKMKIRARVWLFVIFLLLNGAHYFFYRFSIDESNVVPITQGLTFACVLWTTFLLGGMLFRQSWTRYVLVTMMCLALIFYCWAALYMASQSINPLPDHLTKSVIIGLALYMVALIPLGASRSLRGYLAPRTAGER
jgi:hypothetical protein